MADSSLALVIIAILLVATIRRNEVWRDDLTLWQDVVAKSPGRADVHAQLADAWLRHGHRTEALAEYHEAIRLALWRPGAIDVAMNTGGVALANAAAMYVDTGLLREADALLDATAFPKNFAWYNQKAVILLRTNRFKEAIDVLREGEVQFPTSAGLYYNEAEAHKMLYECDEARRLYAKADAADRTAGYVAQECK